MNRYDLRKEFPALTAFEELPLKSAMDEILVDLAEKIK